MKLLILTLDTRGDVQPFVALPRGLANAGHEAVLAAPHRFEGFVGDQGAPFAGTDEPEVAGLLALLLLTESRRASRTGTDGSLVLLGEQDRTQWDRALIAEGQAILRRCLGRSQPGAYQLQAAINAVHADAPTVEQTDWSQIVALYDQLLVVVPTPVVALNRAIAIGEQQDPAAALALVEGLEDLDNYYPFHATRADLLRRLGRHREAAAAYQRAAALAPTEAEREFLRMGGRASRRVKR